MPPSDKFSELRGLSTFSSSATGGGENNLAFKCTRKRFILETLHLDVEGGVNERRTTVAVAPDLPERKEQRTEQPTARLAVQSSVTLEKDAIDNSLTKKRAKKSVAFQSDKLDLYDF